MKIKFKKLDKSVPSPIEWEEVEELSDTDRGTNGYGSTGQK